VKLNKTGAVFSSLVCGYTKISLTPKGETFRSKTRLVVTLNRATKFSIVTMLNLVALFNVTPSLVFDRNVSPFGSLSRSERYGIVTPQLLRFLWGQIDNRPKRRAPGRRMPKIWQEQGQTMISRGRRHLRGAIDSSYCRSNRLT